jgi:lysyl-tRNA synthetase class I
MNGFLDKAEIEIPCEKCRRKTKKTIGWVKSNSRYKCLCGIEIKVDASQFKSEIAKVERSLLSLQNTLRKFGG